MFASRAIAITFILAVSSLYVFAQTPPQAAATPEPSGRLNTGSITGQVVDENGQPLKGVTVQIRATSSSENQIVSTDREGRFQINGLAPVDYYIVAWMPAYFFTSARSSRGTNTFRIGDRVAMTFTKGGVVTGKVMDANGDPVVTVNVRVEMVRDSSGRATPNNFSETRLTDDRGIYRIYGLRAGTYVVSAGGPGRASGLLSETSFEFDVPTYAPSSTRETAAEISVRLGEEISDVDIRYSGEKGRVISGDVTVPAKSHQGFAVMLTTGGRADYQQAQTFYKSENKLSFVFNGIADGEYSLIAQSYSPENEMAISESKPVTVQGKDVTGIQLATKLLGAVSGRVVLANTKIAECTNNEQPLATETSVFAWPRDETAKQVPQFIRSRVEPARPDEKGNFLLKNLPPGAYYFGPSLRTRQWYVQSIAFGPPVSATTNAAAKAKQVDATRVWTNVKTGDRLSGLTITLAQGGATLRGEFGLAPGERAPAGLFLYLVPVEREKADDVLRFFATPIAANGYFELYNIAPDRYWVLAQTGGGDSGAGSPKVRLPHESGTRAQLRQEAEAAKTEIEFKPCQEIMNFKFPVKPQEQ